VRIDALLREGITRSFEFFPPKSDDEAVTLAHTLADLETLRPSFVSVTYRGGPESRQRTYDLVTRLQSEGHLTPMAHLICVGHPRAQMTEILLHYRDAGVENVMALGGDLPEGGDTQRELEHAIDLVELAREVGSFSIGVAAHPDGHPRSPDRQSDRRYLAAKLALADFAVTQFFFELTQWTHLVEEVGALGVTKPILPGIMPVTTISGIDRMAAMGASVPETLVARLRAAHERGGPAAVRAEGIAAATQLCDALLEAGAPGIHFYTLNRSTATREIHDALFSRRERT
jgi:methylenetetrahydrofolate reductase (NADH)